MKLILTGLLLILIVATNAQWHQFPRQFAQGSRDMLRAYRDMKKANWIGADHYFHARGNRDAAKRGPGGKFAARVISDAREFSQNLLRRDFVDSAADQIANHWGRNGQDPNIFRPKGLPSKY